MTQCCGLARFTTLDKEFALPFKALIERQGHGSLDTAHNPLRCFLAPHPLVQAGTIGLKLRVAVTVRGNRDIPYPTQGRALCDQPAGIGQGGILQGLADHLVNQAQPGRFAGCHRVARRDHVEGRFHADQSWHPLGTAGSR